MTELYENRTLEVNRESAQDHFRRRPQRIGDATSACFAASGVSFLACVMGLFINQLFAGIFAVIGTAVVGLFYLAIGIWRLACDRPAVGSGMEFHAQRDGAYGHHVTLVTEPAGFCTAACPARRAQPKPAGSPRQQRTGNPAASCE